VTPRPKGEPVGKKRTQRKNAAKAKKAAIEREAALFRASYRCEFERDGWRCPARNGLHCHHVKRRSQGGTDEASNLVCLCHGCHAWIHDNPAESRRLGYLA
jgi:hypothetical protein